MTKAMDRMARLAFRARLQRGLAPLMALALITVPLAPLHAASDDDDEATSSPNWYDGIGDSIGNTFKGMGKAMGLGKPPGPPPAESPSGCPTIEVLDGTGQQRVMANAQAGNQGLRYQYSITDVARECHLNANEMVIKVGVAGRVLLGPSGSPGGFKVPVRIAVMDERQQKPAVSKLYQIDASIPQGRTGTPYALVADQIVIPFAAGRVAKEYSIKVGIDGSKADKTEKAPGRNLSAAAAPDPSLKPVTDSGNTPGHGQGSATDRQVGH